jgi:hypothetical protein
LEEYDDDIEDVVTGKGTGMRTKNEVPEEIAPVKIDHSIQDSTIIEFLGLVERVMDTVIIISAHTNGEYRVLDEGGLVVTESRQIVGTVLSFMSPF